MIRNYFTIAWRNLLKHKMFSFINIFGLSVGIGACLLIFIYVHHELTYDQFNKKYERIARVTTLMHTPESDLNIASTPIPLAASIRKDFPEIEEVALLEPAGRSVKLNNDYSRENNLFSTDQHIFSVLDFEFEEGSKSGCLEKPNSIIISSSLKKKYFGNTSALGKIMVCDGSNEMITGVFKDRPANADNTIDGLLYQDYNKLIAWMDDLPVFTFVLFRDKPNFQSFSKKLENLSARYIQPELDAAGAKQYKMAFNLEPLSQVHFSKGKLADTPKGNKQYNYIFSILAIFILFIAMLNYINLSTARSAERAKEVGIRKVSGAPVIQLIFQFLFESLLLIAVAWLIAIAMVKLSMPLVNQLLQTKLEIDWSRGMVFMIILFILTILFAGIYPAFILSSYKPVVVLKGSWKNSTKGVWLRKTITVMQFGIAAALIFGTTVINSQLHFIAKKDLGFNRDQLLNIDLPKDSVLFSQVAAFQNELKQRPEISGLTVGNGMTSDGISIGSTTFQSNGRKRELMCNYYSIDPNFLSVFGIKLLEGRNISEKFATDKTEAFIVNEAFIKMVGWKNPIGQSMEGFFHKGKVIGVVKNFYYKSLHNVIEPVILVYNNTPANTTTIKVKPADLGLVKVIFKKYFPANVFDAMFVDEMVNRQYLQDKVTMNLFNDFTMLSIIVSCLGLYGLVSLIAIQRSKEIGIRKVLGASLSNLVKTLSGGFIKLVCFALVIALPITGLLMHRWLDSYAYHTNLQWWMFTLPALITLILAFIVISKQVIQTALINPVTSLRSE